MNKNTQQDKQQFVEDLKQEWNIKDKKKEISQSESTLTKFDPKELERLSKLKLTPIKQKRVINLYSQSSNLTKVARKVGISLRAIYKTMERDSEFKQKIMDIRAGFCEDMKDAMVVVGTSPDARGANDRHRYLQAYDPAFAKSPETAIQVNITSENAHIELKNLLDKPVTKPVNAEFSVIEEE